MNQLINQFETGLFLYQLCVLLHLILTPIAIFQILKKQDRFKQPAILIFLVIVFPFIVSIPLLISLKVKKTKI
ncbi:hypothetical protein FLACHUCJ7_02257 [Flavobacterium chungangense]|uniref:Uncharacterized protein n=1 Tax=Flavobacterium chungangense TaxID=554283 RepID=A0A6V6Z080_9FLAO|nr:hypothetical protein FLACHUCJ7_02257 [Flavobacterium chungangense]